MFFIVCPLCQIAEVHEGGCAYSPPGLHRSGSASLSKPVGTLTPLGLGQTELARLRGQVRG